MKNSEYPKLSELTSMRSIARPVYFKKMENFVSTNGKTCVALHVYDGYSTIRVNIFDVTVEVLHNRGLSEKNVYYCKFSKNEKGFVNLDGDPSPLKDPDIRLSDFGQRIEQDADELFSNLLKLISMVRDTKYGEDTLSDLAVRILMGIKEDFVRSSAAISMHHEQEGGLVLHSLNVACAAYYSLKVYKNLDAELLVCGAALHDIGKIKEYKTDELGYATYSPLGQGLGHMIYGIEIVDEYAGQENYNKERVELLKHIIASHHGELEYGAVAKPCIPEAVLIHSLDDADAKLNMFEKIYKDLKPGENTEKTLFGLDTKAYKPSYLK